MAGTFRRRPLSGSTHGRGIKLTGTATGSSVTIHTATADATMVDVVTLYASNFDTVTRTVSLEWGGTTSPDDILTFQVPPKSTVCLIPDLVLRNTLIVKGWADVANMVSIFGFINTET